MQQIVIGNIRILLLSEDIVRIEYGKNGVFCDCDTFFIPNKSQYANTNVPYTAEENAICFGEYELYIPENAKSLSGVRLDKNGKKVYSYKKLKNSGELPPLDKTPDVFAISDAPRIIVPEGGYSAERKGEYKVTENVQDVYLLLCGGDAKKLRKLYVELTGKPELVRLSTLGGWNSKYYAYTEDEANRLILDYEKHDVPLDVMVIDTDWRSCEHGWGYDINTKLFPDMKRFLDFAHEHGVEVMFNDHPEPADGAHVFEPREIAYREKNLQSLMEKGLDIWWYDRNWGAHLISPTDKIYWETFGLYLFEDITRHYNQKQAGDAEVYRRPVIMGNAVNIVNGRYYAIEDSASHRYSIQWTGDISCRSDSIANEVESLIKCGNNCVVYVNADCGGHLGDPDKELFIRWMQFGTLSPVFRPHCTNTVERTREPWMYDGETLDIVREYNNLRYRLLPVIYRSAYESYENGAPIFKALGWNYPEDKKAAELNDEYMLGENLLIKPVTGAPLKCVDKKHYIAPVKATYYNGRELEGEPVAVAEYDRLNLILNHTSPENGVPVYDFSACFETQLRFDMKCMMYISCDDGATVWIDGEKVLEDKTLHSAMTFPLKKLEAGKTYDIKINYFQAGGEACCGLFAADVQDDKVATYLPAGKWLDAFGGEVYDGKNTVLREYGLKEMPLFVRLGALIPLAYEAKNTKQQKWDKLVFDFYPYKQASDKGYLYEDDTQTTAYKKGEFKKSAYKAGYCNECNAYVINLYKAEGNFEGEKCFNEREITVKRHVSGGERATKATVNGAEAQITHAGKNENAFPLNTCSDAPDGECELITFTADEDKTYEIKFYL